MKKILLLICFFSFSFLVFSQMSFSGVDINTEDQLLFSVEHTPILESSYKALYWYDLNKPVTRNQRTNSIENPRLLSCFPETINVLQKGKKIQVRNRYGTAQYSVEEKSLKWVELPQEIRKNKDVFLPVEHHRLEPQAFSSDGNYVCYIDKTTVAARGNLIIKDLNSLRTVTLATSVEISYDNLPVLWSPDSSIVIYENKGTLYFLSLKSGLSKKQIPEQYREIGKGTIRNVFWSTDKKLIYISHDLVYSISSNELYTRALYSDLVGTGRIVGRLPTPFISSEDRFWTDETGSSIILLQDNRTLWYLELSGVDFSFVTTLFSYPFVTVPGTALNFDVFWTPFISEEEKQTPIIWISMLKSGKTETYVYRLQRNASQNNTYFSSLPLPTFVSKPKLSPDKKSISFISELSFQVYDIETWKQKAVFNSEGIVCSEWLDDSSIYLGGKESVRYWNIKDDTNQVLFLSSIEKYGWDGLTKTVIASIATKHYLYNQENNVWEETNTLITRKATSQNTKWRVFVDSSSSSWFSNTLFARELKPQSTNKVLFTSLEKQKNQTSKPKVSIVFDALDNADGLTAILNTLNQYELKSTFFINGEFIRRFPSGLTEILSAKHQCGSMFYTPYSLSAGTYKIDEDYIRRGLARNEDDFYASTGQELSVIWHAPGYFYNSIIQTATDNSGYTYIPSGLYPQDMITLEEAAIEKKDYKTSSQLVDEIIENIHDGAVIPVSVGIANGNRSDYLYDKLDVLISAILALGYEIVPVTDIYW